MSPLIKEAKKEAGFLKKLALLVGFREAYFFSKNFLGMAVHPQLTTAKILSKKDFSQAFLVFGLPFNLWLVFSLLTFLIWLILRPSGLIFRLGLAFFILVGFFLFCLMLYYLYWVARYLKKLKKI